MHHKAVTYPDLYLNGNKIKRAMQFNYLCLILQANLSWNKHQSYFFEGVKNNWYIKSIKIGLPS